LDDIQLTHREKQQLKNDIFKLPQAHLGTVIQIIQRSIPSAGQSEDDEIEIDIDQLNIPTLRELQRYVKRALVQMKESAEGGDDNATAAVTSAPAAAMGNATPSNMPPPTPAPAASPSNPGSLFASPPRLEMPETPRRDGVMNGQTIPSSAAGGIQQLGGPAALIATNSMPALSPTGAIIPAPVGGIAGDGNNNPSNAVGAAAVHTPNAVAPVNKKGLKTEDSSDESGSSSSDESSSDDSDDEGTPKKARKIKTSPKPTAPTSTGAPPPPLAAATAPAAALVAAPSLVGEAVASNEVSSSLMPSRICIVILILFDVYCANRKHDLLIHKHGVI
jgi:hypothetical protein